ncbi:DUF3575 domain-containing protein [Flagellimonas meridianipacifica]|uniref:Uncharacterized protein DUF3575 n=1 Tax=Flagellimonas meridianipacifica TaxID=1080225 RepID=A0A2T0M8P7_9FLAO|nr:DUF3575 domain-containing protein [Allomuricauda pacifica]PRX53874.1 uncharacterized protein DUF3575 [Allomuricauda pacifica]
MRQTLTILFLLCSLFISAQGQRNVEDSQFKVNFINPGLEYEVGIAQSQTLNFGAGLQFGVNSNGYAFFPALNGQYRYYYNFNRRLERNKQVRGNSANYLAASGTLFVEEVIIGDLESGNGYFGFVGPVYGFQRTYRSGFNFSAELGVGYYFDNFLDDDGFGPTASFSIGWVIGKGWR